MAKNIAEEIRHPDEVERGEGGGVEPLIMTDKDGRIVSAASLRENPYTGEMYVSYMATNPELLGKGHGSEMFNRITKMAAERNQGISLDATEHSAPFWEKMGGKVGKDGWYHWTPEEVKARAEEATPQPPKRISQMEPTDVGIMKPDGSLVIGSRSNPDMPTPNEHADLVGGIPKMVEIMNDGGVRFGQFFEEDDNPGFVSISQMTPKGVENALKVIEQMPVNELTFEAYGDKNYFQADGSPKEVAGKIRKEMAKREGAQPKQAEEIDPAIELKKVSQLDSGSLGYMRADGKIQTADAGNWTHLDLALEHGDDMNEILDTGGVRFGIEGQGRGNNAFGFLQVGRLTPEVASRAFKIIEHMPVMEIRFDSSDPVEPNKYMDSEGSPKRVIGDIIRELVKRQEQAEKAAAAKKLPIDEKFKVPEGYAPFLQEMRDDQVRTVKAYQGGERPIAEYDNGKYRVAIMSGGRELMFKSGEDTPVPSGIWQDYHDPDLDAYGLTEAKYKALSFEERAKATARVQADKYAEKEYDDLKHSFYNPKEAFGTGPGTGTHIRHPQAPVDIRDLKYPPVKDAETGKPVTIHAYRASDHPEFRTNEERGTFFSPEATPEHGNHIYRAKLEFKNPLVAEDGMKLAADFGDHALAKKYEGLLSGWDSDEDKPLDLPYEKWGEADKELAALAKESGHDGIVFTAHDDLNPVQYIAVDPKAITKSEKVGQYSWSSLKVEPEEATEEAATKKEKPAGDWKQLHDLGEDHDIPSEEGYVYHATNAERAGDIAEAGKLNVHKPDYGTDQDTWPDGTTEKRSYFTKKANTAWQFAPEEGKSVLVRTKLDPAIHKTESTGDLYSKKALPASKLEVLGADKEWHPIEDLKEEEAAPEPIGVHHDDLPYRAKYASVDFDKPDLQDTGKRVTAETIRKDYVRKKQQKEVSIYQAYIPMEDLPTPKFVDEEEENFDRQDYRPRTGSPIKVDIHKNGSVNILDGNHRVQVWGEQGQEYAPAWVVDHRHPGIEMLSEDEKAEREEED